MLYGMTKERGIGADTYPCYNADSTDLLAGQPVMRRYPLTYAGGVMHPVGAGGLGEFAGIMTRKLTSVTIGDITSAGLAVEGEVKASVYVDGTPSTYVAGAQLAPYYVSASGKWALIRVAYYTGITLLENWSAKTASQLYGEDDGDGGGAWVEIAPGVAVQKGLQHYVWDGVLVADVDYFVTSVSMQNAAYTLANTVPDFPRNVTVTVTAVSTGDTMGTVLVTGLDIYGATITETLTPAAGSTVAGNKAFASITSIVGSGWSAAAGADSITFGTGVKLGLARVYGGAPPVLQAKAAGTVEGTAPTLAVDSDDISGNTISFNTAPNSNRLEAWVAA